MPFSVTCPSCKGINTCEETAAGKQVHCQFCGAAVEAAPQSSEQISEGPAPSLPGKPMRPVSAPVDDLNDFPKQRPRAIFERHRREGTQRGGAQREAHKTVPDESGTLSFDPIQWAPVRKGLAMVFWGWAAILGIWVLFVAYWLF